MFDRIAPRYDLLNRVLSLGIDKGWRKKLAASLPKAKHQRVLDLATGTGDVVIALAAAGDTVGEIVGMDMSPQMLEHGKVKLAELGLLGRAKMELGDATSIPATDASFDAVTISFGIRNVVDVPRALREMHRVVKPGGRALVLEFSLPTSAVLRPLYLFYFRNILPRVGALISGDQGAYTYLNETAERFPAGEAFCALMRDAGFVEVRATPLTFGIATLYAGDRAAPRALAEAQA
jgi:demethylmenaquinone methyltransferase/2-methoxy-6-polyprenyl-1,4-benzoquinol methylase